MIKNNLIKEANKYIKQLKVDYPKEFFDKTAVMADFSAGYRACLANQGWVNVEDELPNTTKSVLVKGTIPSGEETIQVARLYKRGWVTDTYFKVDVKEWKPILL